MTMRRVTGIQYTSVVASLPAWDKLHCHSSASAEELPAASFVANETDFLRQKYANN
jgi:hypothetical protein